MVKIMVVEDNERVASSVKKGLASQGYLVNVFGDAESAIKEAKSVDYDLLLIDIMLPRMNGIELSKQMRAAYPRIPIIMLTALGSIDEKISGFDAGADDYMVKPFEIRELFARIAVLLKRHREISEEEIQGMLTYDRISIDLRSKQVHSQGQPIKLTPKEFDLLHFFLKHRETMLSKDEIARNVWSKNFDTGTNYIDVYINYLRKKIDRDFSPKLIHTKSGHGFILSNKE
ncbi:MULTISPECIES: response regulator transcription factor [Sphingobacterium]|uniref:response regulator transcription factor n=1 Tax=Sphingobacterium TaxID=28453 RepID=UPI000E9CC8C9|nr:MULTISPECIES: response regulator transcription factor [Sphingobacterium]QQT62715.1 response regulator transcription factor [Sphingobacterium multivorum]HAU54519.1 DNA-binding response regulator [Sphingobacterium sp.]HCX55529.1 DNA-binding response regulator [Sphingobacterium sp.]